MTPFAHAHAGLRLLFLLTTSLLAACRDPAEISEPDQHLLLEDAAIGGNPAWRPIARP